MSMSSMNNCGAGRGRRIERIDEVPESLGPLNLQELNKKLDAWLAKNETGEVKEWRKRVYGKNKKK